MKEDNPLRRAAESLVGPGLDWLGSWRANERGMGNIVDFDLVDLKTGLVIGSGFEVVRDGMVMMNWFFEPSSLRKKIFPRQNTPKGGDT